MEDPVRQAPRQPGDEERRVGRTLTDTGLPPLFPWMFIGIQVEQESETKLEKDDAT